LFYDFFVGDRSSTGLIEFSSKSDAAEGLILANHETIPNPSKYQHM